MSDAPEALVSGVRPARETATAVVLEGRALRKVYVGGDGGELTVLDGVEIRVAPGEVVAIVGASGAGKSTLLHLLGCLDRPTSGGVLVGGEPIFGLTDREMAVVRYRKFGLGF